MNHPPTTQHNYMAKTIRLYQTVQLAPGEVYHATVAHDDWCDLLHGRGNCNCDPDIQLVDCEGRLKWN